MAFAKATLIEVPRVVDARGTLSFVEGSRQVPFPIRRVFYLYDLPPGARRAGHAVRRCQQVLLVLSGCVDVELDDGFGRESVHLDRPSQGLYLPPLTWRTLENFSSGAVCLVLASARYDEAQYLRDYPSFLAAVRKRRG